MILHHSQLELFIHACSRPNANNRQTHCNVTINSLRYVTINYSWKSKIKTDTGRSRRQKFSTSLSPYVAPVAAAK